MAALKPQPIPKDLKTFDTVLSDGRKVVFREAITQDLIYIQNVHGKKSETEQALYMMARLATGDKPITLGELQVLPLKELNNLSALVSKCTGYEDEVEADPFE